MAIKTLSTTLQDKDGAYNRLRKARPITAESGDPLNRTGHVIAGSLWERTLPCTCLSFDGSHQNKSQALHYLTTYRAVYDAELASTRT